MFILLIMLDTSVKFLILFTIQGVKNMKKELKKWLIECKTTLGVLQLKRLKVLTKDYEKIIIDTQINDINVIIKKIKKILQKGDIT